MIIQGALTLAFISIICGIIAVLATPVKFSVSCTLDDSSIEFIGYDVYENNKTIVYFTEPNYVKNVYNMNEREYCSFNKIK